jgi:sterol-4alpha-carboxylate 3-dehydrogenase (decarboxylating)
MHGIRQVYERNQTHFQIGDNQNLFDWTYVGNVAYAHILAADKLVPSSTEDWQSDTRTLKEEEQDILFHPLPSISLTTGSHRVPTSEARPLGPYITRPADGDKLEAAFNKPYSQFVTETSRPVIRSRFDQFSDVALARSKTAPLDVAGQVFIITNGEPTYFWDFIRLVFHHLDLSRAQMGLPPRKQKSLIKFSRPVAMVLAGLAEWWGGLVGKEAAFTKFRVQFSCVDRYYNIEKARRVLGYEPQVGLEEGIKRMFEVRRLSPFLFLSAIY